MTDVASSSLRVADTKALTRPAARALSHNLNGQRLGRKGRDTRDRIIAAAQILIADRYAPLLTLSAVAREASLGMTSLYNYFGDLTELLLALLEPVVVEAETAYISKLRARWSDETLNADCLDFVSAFYAFWQRNSRLLHLRNSLGDQQDARMAQHRVASASPLIQLFVEQMGHDATEQGSPAFGMATVLYAGIERIVSIATDADMEGLLSGNFSSHIDNYLQSEARLLELGIRDYRTNPLG
jgi:AcrR family transcriptional regulator